MKIKLKIPKLKIKNKHNKHTATPEAERQEEEEKFIPYKPPNADNFKKIQFESEKEYKCFLELKEKLFGKDADNDFDAHWKNRLDDYCLIKFLRKEELDVEKAESGVLAFHSQFHDQLFADIPKQKLYESLHVRVWDGVDRQGRPLLVDSLGKANFKQLKSQFTEEELVINHVNCIEYGERLCRRMCSNGYYSRHGSTTQILDMRGFGATKINQSTVLYFKTILLLQQLYYPNLFYKLFLINCSVSFMQVWKSINKKQSFIPQSTLDKIVLIKKGKKLDKLFKVVHPNQVPKYLGGSKEDAVDRNGKEDWVLLDN